MFSTPTATFGHHESATGDQSRSHPTGTVAAPPIVKQDDMERTTTAAPPVAQVPPWNYPPLQSEMEEIRFFLQHDLPEEAQDVLKTLLENIPDIRVCFISLKPIRPESLAAQARKPEVPEQPKDETELMLDELLSPERRGARPHSDL